MIFQDYTYENYDLNWNFDYCSTEADSSDGS